MSTSKPLPESIGRFKITRELGKGSQGVVYLGVDPHLGRQVAIKTIHIRRSRDGSQEQRIIQEARTVSKLQHPNIIPVYEVGQSESGPYVVFEFVDGVALRDLIRNNGGMEIDRAVHLMRQILDGISYAHEQGIIHRDMSPANVLVSRNDVPRIMDFGISVATGKKGAEKSDLAGTPCYMSPEHFSGKPMGPQADIFSLGLVMYEMLTGRPAIQAEHEFAAMYKIAHEPIAAPSTANPKVNRKLDGIVLKALARELGVRYATASDMKKALEDYLSLEAATGAGGTQGAGNHGTLEFLLRRMQHKKDFPTFSQYIVEINQKASVKDRNFTSADQLANVITKDYALTNKILRLVNSAFYGTPSGTVTTVSRAVAILGFEQVKLAAASLILFDHLQNKSQKSELQDSAVSSFMSALIAKEQAKDSGLRSSEEAFICAMLHRLGRHLVIFYFPEEYEQIKNQTARQGIDEAAACEAVLGISYNDIGAGVAKTWNFPEKIIRSMRSMPQEKLETATSEEDLLWTLAAFSNDLCRIAGSTDGEQGEKELGELLERYGEGLHIARDRVFELLEGAREKIETYSGIWKISTKKSAFLNRVDIFCTLRDLGPTLDDGEGEKQEEQGSGRDRPESSKASENPTSTVEPKIADALLLNGIQEITNTLLQDFEINDVVTMILETMYTGFRFHHVLLCLLDRRKSKMVARFGFGEGMDTILDRFEFPVNGKSPDVFNLALAQGNDLGIENAADPRIKGRLPKWYLDAAPAPAFLLCPIVVNGSPLGLVYADRITAGPVVSGNQMKYMKTLCNQAVLAMKQITRRA